METYQSVLVIVIIGCVAALFYIWLANRKSSGERPTEIPMDAVSMSPVMPPDNRCALDHGPVVNEEAAKHLPPSDQLTIYAFEREVQVYVCPRCDGENSVHRNICCICGFEFRKGAWHQ